MGCPRGKVLPLAGAVIVTWGAPGGAGLFRSVSISSTTFAAVT
jgi:hypothetical protein